MNKLTTSLLLSLLMCAPFAKAQTSTTETSGSTTFEDSSEFPAENSGAETDADSANVLTGRPRSQRLPLPEISSWVVGLTSLQWNEKLTVTQTGAATSSNMNFNGMGVLLQKEFAYMQWGWSVEGMLAAGRANSGPFPNDIKVDRQNFKMFAITPRAFWRLSESINLGGSAMIYVRNIDLPVGAGVDSSAGQKENVALMADMSLRIFNKWDFYQALGPIAKEAYLWKIGVNYRF